MIWKYYDDADDQGDFDDNRPKGGCAVSYVNNTVYPLSPLYYHQNRPERGCAVQGSHKVDIVSHSYLQHTSVLVDFMKKWVHFMKFRCD